MEQLKLLITLFMLSFSISMNAQYQNDHVSVMGISLGSTPEQVKKALIAKGFTQYSSDRIKSKLKMKGQLNGYLMSAEIESDGKSTIHSMVLRTYNHDTNNNKRDFAKWKKWLTEQYGDPDESGIKNPEGYDYAKWIFSKTQDITIKTTDHAYISMQFLDDHKVKYMDLATILSHVDKKKVEKLDTKKEAEKIKAGVEKAKSEISKLEQPQITAADTIAQKTATANTVKKTTAAKKKTQKASKKKKAAKKKTTKKK